jgi:hypothetical protein
MAEDELRLEERITKAGLTEKNNLTGIMEIGGGIAIAVRELKIGKDKIVDDDVLIEEVSLSSDEEVKQIFDQLQGTVDIFKEFSSSSTPAPIYRENPAGTKTIYLIHSTPGISLDKFLDGINKASATKHNYNHFAMFGGWWKKKNEYKKQLSERWQQSTEKKKGRKAKTIEKLAESILLTPKAYSSAWKDFLGQEPRIKLARRLFYDINRKHKRLIGQDKAPVYHDNISPETIFVQDNFKIVFLSNYFGKESAILKKYTPEIILTKDHERTKNRNYGEQTKDVHALAAIAYQIVTGEKLDSRRFRMDSQSFGKLNKATGSFMRCVPVIGSVMNALFPTKIAKTLRNVLDEKYNEKNFGLHSKINRKRKNKENADLDHLISAFDVKEPGENKRLEEFVENKTELFPDRRKGFKSDYKSKSNARTGYFMGTSVKSVIRTAAVTSAIGALIYGGLYFGVKYDFLGNILIKNYKKIENIGVNAKPAAAVKPETTIAIGKSVSKEDKPIAEGPTYYGRTENKDDTGTGKPKITEEKTRSEKFTKVNTGRVKNNPPYPVSKFKMGDIPLYYVDIGTMFPLRDQYVDPDKGDWVAGLKLIEPTYVFLDGRGYIGVLSTVKRYEVRGKNEEILVEAKDNHGNKRTDLISLRFNDPLPILVKTNINGVYDIRNVRAGCANLGAVWYDDENISLGGKADPKTKYCVMVKKENKYEVLTVKENQGDLKFYSEMGEYKIKEWDKFCFWSDRKKLENICESNNVKSGGKR